MILLSDERRRAVESLLARLAGVHSAHVETSPSGHLEGIHVISTGRFSPSQQARNIESALLAALNLDLDPRLISVATLKEEVEADGDDELDTVSDPFRVPERRVRLQQILYQQEGFKITAYAELAWEGRTFRGSYQDTDTAKGRMVGAARAVLDALERLADGRAAFFLEGLETHQTFERRIVVASLRIVSAARRVDLVGCAMIEEDPNFAAAQAVLGAVNRSLAQLLVTARPAPEAARQPVSQLTTGEARERYALS